METLTRKKGVIRRWFFLCAVRHSLIILSTAVMALFFVLRGNSRLMNGFVQTVVRPYHRFAGGVTSAVSFSVAECVYVLMIALVLVYIILSVVDIVKKDKKCARFYRMLAGLLAAGLLTYSGVTVLWSTMYYADGFEEKSGIAAEPPAKDDLYLVTLWFADLANEYARRTARDESGVFAVDSKTILRGAAGIYDGVCEKYSCLSGEDLRPKPLKFSELMSFINFTGFFFPFTGEANLNISSPACLLPADIAHELAHQRGVAPEQEANFVAVLTCLSSGDDVYVYSGALMAYIYLGNALYSADSEKYFSVRDQLSAAVKADLSYNDSYWHERDTKVAAASESVYAGFLQSNGQSLGIESYGACVELLVSYYKDFENRAVADTKN